MTSESSAGMPWVRAPRLLVSSLVFIGFVSLIALCGCDSSSSSSNGNGQPDAGSHDVIDETMPTEADTDAALDITVDTTQNDVDTQDVEQDVAEAEPDALPYDKGVETISFTSGWLFDRDTLEGGETELNKHPEGVKKEAAFIGHFAQESLLIPPTGRTSAYAMRAKASDDTDHFVVVQRTVETNGLSLKKPIVTLRMKWESFVAASDVKVGYGDDDKAVLMFVYPPTSTNSKACVGALAQGKIRFVKVVIDSTETNKVDLEITGSRLEMRVANSVTISESITKLLDEEGVGICQ